MNCKLYANIGVGHENDWEILQGRVIAAAQCNADAVIINKSTPHLVIPQEKQYLALESKWGTLPYIEVAKRSELSTENIERIRDFTDQIGIPIIWSVTDSRAAEVVKEHCNAHTIKLHYDSVDVYELCRYCKDNFDHVLYSLTHAEYYEPLYGNHRKHLSVYHTTKQFPPEVTDLNLSVMDKPIMLGYSVGYEGREAGIFPALALGYRGVDYVEKYLGEDNSDNPSVLTPAQFYDLFNSMLLLEEAEEVRST